MVFLVRFTLRRSIQIWGVLKMLLWDWRSTEAQRSVTEVLRCCICVVLWLVVVKPSPAACWWPRPDGVKVPVTHAKRKHSPGLSSPRQLHEDKCLWAALRCTWTSCCSSSSAVVTCRAERAAEVSHAANTFTFKTPSSLFILQLQGNAF